MAERNTPTIALNGEEIGLSKTIDFVEGDNTGISIEYDELNKHASVNIEATGDVEGSPGYSEVMWLFEDEIEQATGTEPTVMMVDGEITAVGMTCGAVPSVTDVIGNIRKNDIPLWDNLVDQPRIEVGEYASTVFPVPSDFTFVAGDLFTADCDQAGPPSTNVGGFTDVRSMSAIKQSFTAAVNNINTPLPINYHAGDLLINVTGLLAATIDSYFDASWTEIGTHFTSGSNNLRLYFAMHTAIEDESALQTITFSNGTPYISYTYAVANALDEGGQPDDQDAAESNPAGTAQVTMPAMTASLDHGLAIVASVARLVNGTAGLYTDPPPDSGNLVLDMNDCTTRTGTNVNLAMQGAHMLVDSAGAVGPFEFENLTVDTEAASRLGIGGIVLFQGPTGDSPGENVIMHMLWSPA